MNARERKNARERDRRARLRADNLRNAVVTEAGRRIITRTPAVPLGDWSTRGECRKHDPDLWFSVVPAETEKAIAICADCPVYLQCGQWANETGQQFGVWAGIDREVTRSRRIAS
jgi:WhiB family redox-sensing transcriptional regulator